MKYSLLPITRLVLGVSAVVQLLVGLLCLFVPDLTKTLVLWPFEPISDLFLRYAALLYLGCSLAAGYALAQDSWVAARTYLALSGFYIASGIALGMVTALTAGVPAFFWVFMLLCAIYMPLWIYTWRAESANAISPAGIAAGSRTSNIR